MRYDTPQRPQPLLRKQPAHKRKPWSVSFALDVAEVKEELVYRSS